jgi:phosphopantothenoylcysteine synthetase/decarboxylase
MSPSKILFQLSGSIACYKACHLISRLVQEGFEVQTAATASALQFVSAATLEGLTGRPVFSDIYKEGQVMDHIKLAQWADLAIVCPATANTINSLAQGLAQDCIGNLFLAYDLHKPYLIAPAMNQGMYQHPATQTALEKLKSWKVDVLPTDHGYQACGDVGPGRLLNPDQIYERIHEALKGRL